jgi:hypothetical protein
MVGMMDDLGFLLRKRALHVLTVDMNGNAKGCFCSLKPEVSGRSQSSKTEEMMLVRWQSGGWFID